MHKVLLENMVFHAFHGLFEEEAVIGGKFVVNLEIETDFSASMQNDSIEGTIDYSEVFKLVEEEMGKRSKLIEHVGRRIVDRLYASFPAIQFLRIKISKVDPPISGEIQQVSIVIEE